MKTLGHFATGLIGVSVIASSAPAQLRIATWNVTNYSSGRANAFQTAIFGQFQGRSFNPDVLIVQELLGASARQNFLNILNSAPGQNGGWEAAPFLDTGDSDSGMFYRKNKVNFQGLANIVGDPRATQRYDFNLKGFTKTQVNISLYSSHLKAGSSTGGTDEQRRLFETTNIRTDAAIREAAGRHIILGGDFNISTSNDASYRQLTDASVSRPAGPLTGGRFYDPINTSFTPTNGGITWNNNQRYRYLHTQDPYGSGGMDDRFDFLMIGESMRDKRGFEYIGSHTQSFSQYISATNPGTWNDPNHSYRVWGNDGGGFNGTLRVTGNTMVGPTIAQALIDATGNPNPNNVGGHLPVFMDMKLPGDFAVDRDFIDFGVTVQDMVRTETITIRNAVDTSIWDPKFVEEVRIAFEVTGDFEAPGGEETLTAGAGILSGIRIKTATPGSKFGTLRVIDRISGEFKDLQLSGLVMVPEPGTVAALSLGALALLRRRKRQA